MVKNLLLMVLVKQVQEKKTFYIVDSHHPIVTCGIYKPQDTSILLPILLMFLAAQSPQKPNGNWAAPLSIEFVMEKDILYQVQVQVDTIISGGTIIILFT